MPSIWTHHVRWAFTASHNKILSNFVKTSKRCYRHDIYYDIIYVSTLQVVSPPLQRGHYPFFTFSDGRESSIVVPPPSSTFTLSIRQQSDAMDSGNDDDFVVIECAANNQSPDSTSDAVVVGSCEPDTMTSLDSPAESNSYVVVDSQTTEHSLNSTPH